MKKPLKFFAATFCAFILNFFNYQKSRAIEFSFNYNIEERQFIIKSWTGINGAWPPWDLPKFCHIESCISHNYENGDWKNHYVRCFLGDHKHDSGRCYSGRIMGGYYAGWYHAEANSNGNCSDGTGYSFYGY